MNKIFSTALLCVVACAGRGSADNTTVAPWTLVPMSRQVGSACDGTTRYEMCDANNGCCKLPLRCCGAGKCCRKEVKCDMNKPSSANRVLQQQQQASERMTLLVTGRQTTCSGSHRYESCGLSACCVLPKCCCPSSPSGCCEREGKKCFPGSATVALRSGIRVSMAKLRLGDEVAIAPGVYSRVFAFSHRDVDATSSFVRLHTASGHVVTASAGHMLLVLRGDGSRAHVAADGVHEGDLLPVIVAGRELASPVVRVRAVRDTGLYNPHTLHGAIVVDGVVCSTYTRHVPMRSAHGLLAPVRAGYRLISSLLRLTSA